MLAFVLYNEIFKTKTCLLAKTFFIKERQGWRVELQQPPNCQRENTEIHPWSASSSGLISWSDCEVMTLISTGPSPPLHLKLCGEKLVLLPPEWAACQRRREQDSQNTAETKAGQKNKQNTGCAQTHTRACNDPIVSYCADQIIHKTLRSTFHRITWQSVYAMNWQSLKPNHI